MRIKAKIWVVAFSFAALGLAIAMDMGLTGFAGYVTGVWFTSLWVYVLGRKS